VDVGLSVLVLVVLVFEATVVSVFMDCAGHSYLHVSHTVHLQTQFSLIEGKGTYL
jgi:hypothetical protein